MKKKAIGLLALLCMTIMISAQENQEGISFNWIIRQTPMSPANTITELYLNYSNNGSLPILLKIFRYGERVSIENERRSRYFNGEGDALSVAYTWWAGAGDTFQVSATDNNVNLFWISTDEQSGSSTELIKSIPINRDQQIIFIDPIYTGKPDFRRNLSITSPVLFGDDVRYVQILLKHWYRIDPGPIDGYFGPITENAIRKFQDEYDLPVTGAVDQLTFSTLTAFREY